MKILTRAESLQLTQRLSQLLKTGLVLVGAVVILLTTLSILQDRQESETAAKKTSVQMNVGVVARAELILDQAYFSLSAVAADLLQPAETSPLLALQTAMRYDPVSRFLFCKHGDAVLMVDNGRRATTELSDLVKHLPDVRSGMSPVLPPPAQGPSGEYYVPLLISSDSPHGTVTVGSLIPVARFDPFAAHATGTLATEEGMLLLDGSVMVRSAGRSESPGKRSMVGELIAGLAATQEDGDFSTTAPSGSSIAGSFSRSRRFPFIAVSSQNSDGYLGPWRDRSCAKAFVMLFAFGLVGWGARLLYKLNESVSSNEKLYRRLFEDVDEAISVFHPDGTLTGINPRAMALLGVARIEDVMGKKLASLCKSADGEATAATRWRRALQGEHLKYEESLFLIPSNRRVECATSLWAFKLRDQTFLMSVFRDVTNERRHARQQEYLANHDALTGLPNRHSFLRTIDRHIENDATSPAYLILVNLARFREINESFGPRTGDTVLAVSAQRLSGALVGHDWTLARLGGTDFVAYATGERILELDAIRQLIFRILREPVKVDDVDVQFHAHLGISCYPADALDASQLLRCAELATCGAKTNAVHWASYDRELDRSPGHDFKVRTDLATAIREQQLCLFYQPKVWLKDRTLAGAEALLRWRHPTMGWIPPVEFIPLAESTELIHALTRWVLGEALEQIQRWKKMGRPIALAVNISTNNLQDPDFNGFVMDLLDRKAVEPHLLDLEVTEGALAVNPEIVLHRLHEFREAGIGLSLDDFGTGFSSLSYVSQFPFSALKIDRSFVAALRASERDRTVAQSAISLGHELQLKTIAEGVEDEATVQQLIELQCDIGQGYLFGKPMPIDEFNKWITAKPGGHHLAT